jgi:hypothetical protein
MNPESISPTFLIFLEEEACALLLADVHPYLFPLPPFCRVAIEQATTNSALRQIRDVRCSEAQAKELIEHLSLGALALRMTGDARAALCTRAVTATRRGLSRVNH